MVEDSRFSCQRIMSDAGHQKREYVPTWVLPRGYFICWDAKGEHLLSVRAVDCGPHFVAPSGILVNTDESPGVTNEPGN